MSKSIKKGKTKVVKKMVNPKLYKINPISDNILRPDPIYYNGRKYEDTIDIIEENYGESPGR